MKNDKEKQKIIRIEGRKKRFEINEKKKLKNERKYLLGKNNKVK